MFNAVFNYADPETLECKTERNDYELNIVLDSHQTGVSNQTNICQIGITYTL